MADLTFELPKVEVNTFRKSNPLTARITENKRLFSEYDEDNDARHIVLEARGVHYLEGQSLGVLTPGINEKGKSHAVRLYSVASVGSDMGAADEAAFCVKRVVYIDEETGKKKYGVASNYLCDLQIGEELLLTGPAGRNFLLPVEIEINRPYLFFATGTGIAPFLGMLHRLFKNKNSFDQDVYLFFGVKRKSELMYDEEFSEYAEFSNFHYRKALSREQKNDEGGKLYLHDLIKPEKDHIASLLRNPKTLIYVCGLKGMEKGIFERLAATLELAPDSNEFQKLIEGRVLMEVY